MARTRTKVAFVVSLGFLVAAGTLVMMGETGRRAEQARRTEFMVLVNNAFATKRPDILLSLYYWEGVPGEEKRLTSRMVGSFFNPGFAFTPAGPKVVYTPGPSPMQKLSGWLRAVWVTKRSPRSGFTRNGIRYRPNLDQVGTLSVVGLNASRDSTFTFGLGVGEKDGKLRFIGNAQSK